MNFKRSQINNSMAQRISKTGKKHDTIEHWLGHHNRKLELLRTITSLLGAIVSTLVFLRVFHLL
jgi:hypothetical protein